MRIVLALVIALAAAGCAKKSKPAAAPAAQEMKPAEAPGAADEDKTKGGTPTPGDPCDGGETKSK